MPRYDQRYGREYGAWGHTPPLGGMRSEGGWSTPDWRDFPGEEGWYGQGVEPGEDRFDLPLRGNRSRYREWDPFETGYGADFRGGYGIDYRSRGGYGGRGWDIGYPGREVGYGSWRYDRGPAQGRVPERERGTTRVAEIMTSEPESVLPDAPIAEVARKMRDLDVGIIPVIESAENRRLRGVITDRDIAIRAVAEGRENARVEECMSTGVRSVNKNDSIREVMRVMREEKVRRVPVTDRDGRLVGIVAQADLALDYAGTDRDREVAFSSTIERISEPGPVGR